MGGGAAPQLQDFLRLGVRSSCGPHAMRALLNTDARRAASAAEPPSTGEVGPTGRLSRAQRVTMNSTADLFQVNRTIGLAAGKKGVGSYICPFAIDRPAKISWSFQVDKDDIDFEVELVLGDGATQPLRERQRFAASKAWSDCYTVGFDEPVAVRLIWSNAHAWISRKQVDFTFTVEPTGEDPNMSTEDGTALALQQTAAALDDVVLEELDVRAVLYHPPTVYTDENSFGDSAPAKGADKRQIFDVLASAATTWAVKPLARPVWQLNAPYKTLFASLDHWRLAVDALPIPDSIDEHQQWQGLKGPKISTALPLEQRQATSKEQQEAAVKLAPEPQPETIVSVTPAAVLEPTEATDMADAVRATGTVEPMEAVRTHREQVVAEKPSGKHDPLHVHEMLQGDVHREFGSVTNPDSKVPLSAISEGSEAATLASKPEQEQEQEQEPEQEPEPEPTLGSVTNPDSKVPLSAISEGSEATLASTVVSKESRPEQSPMEACSPVDTEDLDRPLELDEPRWLKLLGGGKWELYPNRTNRQLEKKHRVYAQHQRAILERRSKDFYNSRRASDKALGEAANSTLVDETEYLTDADHIQLNVGVSVDFVKMTEASRTDDGAERHLKVKRYEPTSEDKANARDARQRGFVLKELIQTEEVYIDTLVSLQGTIFPRLLAAGKKLTDACRDMVENFKSLVAVQTEFWGSVSVISAQKYFEEHQVVDALADFISKMPQSYTNFVSHFDSFASEVFLAEPALRDHEAQIKDVLIRPIQRVPRYKLFVDQLLKNTSESLPLHAPLTEILNHLHTLLEKLNEQPRMEELKQWNMSLSSEAAAVPNTVVWVYLRRYERAVMPILEALANAEQLRTEEFKYVSVNDSKRIIKKAVEFIKSNSRSISSVVFIDSTDENGPELQHAVVDLLGVCEAEKIHDVSLRGIMSSDHLQIELADASRLVARHLEKLRYRTAVRLLARGAIEVERIYEVQTWFGTWKKPSRMPAFCRNDGSAATPPDLLMLPYESTGLWIWLGEWKVAVDSEQTDPVGWQYAKIRLTTGNEVPQTGWIPTEAGGTTIRRRLHWRFRQRLATLGGMQDKLETANWAMTRTISKVLEQLNQLTADDTPLDRKERWTASAMNPLQEEARDVSRKLMFNESAAGHKELAEWFQAKLQAGAPGTQLKVLWCLDLIVSHHCKQSQAFQRLLRLVISPVLASLAEQNSHPDIQQLAAELSRQMSYVRLPLERHYTELDLQRVKQLLQQLEMDPLRCQLSQGEQDFLWNFRREPLLTESPPMLAKVLLSAPDWEARQTLMEVHALPEIWAPPRVAELLQLLDPTFWEHVIGPAHPATSTGKNIDFSTDKCPGPKRCANRRQALGPIFAFAVSRLEVLPDAQLAEYMLQLAQVVRHQDLLASELPIFLLRRGLAAPATVGHALYWHLRAEMMACIPKVSRHNMVTTNVDVTAFLGLGLIVRTYLDTCADSTKQELVDQEQLIKSLRQVVLKSSSATAARAELRDVYFPRRGVRLPVLAEWVDRLLSDECRMMSSATKPLWLVFRKKPRSSGSTQNPLAGPLRSSFAEHLCEQKQNIDAMLEAAEITATEHAGMLETLRREQSAETSLQLDTDRAPTPAGTAETLTIMFKDGDDLRQDGLVLQSFKLMQQLWEAAGLSIPMAVYRTIDFGGDVGMIEVVPDCLPISKISVDQRKLGRQSISSNISAVYNKASLTNWLKDQAELKGIHYEKMVDNFTRSCAGYCVASYVIGIGDRHNDNILLCRDGHLVHIDFGWILGKNPTMGPFQRYSNEILPMTDDFAAIIESGETGPAKFVEFEQLCCDLYNELRKNAHLFINQWQVMMPAGLEMLTPGSLDFMRDAFKLDEDEAVARTFFKRLIRESLGSLSLKLNWAMHTVKHSGLF